MIQSLLDGLVQGALYAIIALGYTMVYGILLMINFAHGEVLMVGAYAGVLVLSGVVAGGAVATLGILPALLLAFLFAMAVAGAHGVLLERLAYRPLRKAHQLAPLISAIGMSIVLQNYVRLAQGSTPKSLPVNAPEFRAFFGGRGLVFGDAASLRPLDLLILGVCVALMAGLWLFVQRSRLGKAMRATSQDRTMAGLVGIDVDRVITITFAVGSVLAAVAGVLLALYSNQARFSMGFLPGMKAFTAAVLGGIGNIPGAMLGGILLGLFESLFSGFVNTDYKDVFSFALLVLVLIFRPSGLLGRPEVEKV